MYKYTVVSSSLCLIDAHINHTIVVILKVINWRNPSISSLDDCLGSELASTPVDGRYTLADGAQITDISFCWVTEVHTFAKRQYCGARPLLYQLLWDIYFKHVALVAQRLWLVFPFTPIYSHVFHHGSQHIMSNWAHHQQEELFHSVSSRTWKQHLQITGEVTY